MKPATKCDNSNRVVVHFATLALILAALSAFSPALIAQTKATPKAVPRKANLKESLWKTEDLPRDAVFRYGSTSRNPNAIGIYELRFSQDGQLLAARDQRQSIRVLDLEKRELVSVLQTQSSLDFLISPDKQYVISSDRKQTQFWSIADREVVRELKKAGRKLAMSADPLELVIVGKGTVSRYSWPLPSKPKEVLTKLNGRTILPAGVSQDGGIAIFHNGGMVELLNTVTGERIEPSLKLVPKRAIVSPNSHLLAEVNYGDSRLKVFDLRNAARYQYILKDKRPVVKAAFSNDSRFLYTSNYDNSIVIWDLVTMKQVDRVTGHRGRINALAADPGNLLCLASGSTGADKSIIYWNFRDRLFPPIDEPQDGDFDLIWEQLGSVDVKVSLAATNRLFRGLKNESGFWELLADRMGLAQRQDDGLAEQYLTDLDDREYEVREKATAMLKSMVERIRPLLEQKLVEGSQEARWRINKILQVSEPRPSISTAAGRRKHRIVLALDLLGNKRAVAVLDVVVKGSDPTIRELAKSVLNRRKIQN